MLQFSELNRVMETVTISKNGRNLKSQMSKKNLFKSKGAIIIIFLFVMGLTSIMFSSCQSDDGHIEKYQTCNGETSLFSTLKLNVIWDRVNYNYAQAVVYYCNYRTLPTVGDPIYDVIDGTEPVQKYFLVAEAEGENPTLKFKDVPDEYLTNILKTTDRYSLRYMIDNFYNEYSESSITISNENAKVAVIETISTSGSGGHTTIDGVWISAEPVHISTRVGENWVKLVYCNTECNITSEDGKIDVRLKKGWNKIVYAYCDEESSYKTLTLGINDLVFYCTAS